MDNGGLDLVAVTPARLAAVALRHAANPALAQATASTSSHHAVRLVSTSEYEAWLLVWPSHHDTGVHDHAGAVAAVSVAHGSLRLTTNRRDGSQSALVLTPGQVRVIGSADVHAIRNDEPETAVSVHVYAPRRALRRR